MSVRDARFSSPGFVTPGLDRLHVVADIRSVAEASSVKGIVQKVRLWSTRAGTQAGKWPHAIEFDYLLTFYVEGSGVRG